MTVASIEQKIDREHSADELDWGIHTGKARREQRGAKPEAHPLWGRGKKNKLWQEKPALPETTGGCDKDMQIKIAQFRWPRSFSGRLLGGAVQLGRYSDLAGR